MFFFCSLKERSTFGISQLLCLYLLTYWWTLIIVCKKKCQNQCYYNDDFPHERQSKQFCSVFLKCFIFQFWHENHDNFDEWQVSHCVRVRVTWEFRFIYNKLNTQENIWRFVQTLFWQNFLFLVIIMIIVPSSNLNETIKDF